MWDIVKDDTCNHAHKTIRDLRKRIAETLQRYWEDAHSVQRLIGRDWFLAALNVTPKIIYLLIVKTWYEQPARCHHYPRFGLRESLQDILADEDVESLRWWCIPGQTLPLEALRMLGDFAAESLERCGGRHENARHQRCYRGQSTLASTDRTQGLRLPLAPHFRIIASLKAVKLDLQLSQTIPT